MKRLSLLLLLLFATFATTASAWPHSTTAGGVMLSATNTSGGYYNSSTSRVVSDGAGGCYVAYAMYGYSGSNYDVFAQRLDSRGVPLWPLPGVALATGASWQVPAAVTVDTEGSLFVVWTDQAVSGLTQALKVSKVTSAGISSWGAGLTVCNAPGGYANQAQVAFVSWQLMVVWQDWRTGQVDQNIYTQQFNYYGTPQFTANGVPVCSAAGVQESPMIATDDFSSSACIAWVDLRSGTADIYAQGWNWTNSVGMWTANGVAVCNAVGAQTTPVVQAWSGGRFVVGWTDARGADTDIYAQRLNPANGAAMWAANGQAVCNSTGAQQLGDMVVDANGYLVMGWSDARSGNTNLYGQRLDPSGTISWTANGSLIRNSAGDAAPPRMASDGAGGTLWAWQDQRVDVGDIYAQRVLSNSGQAWTSGGVPVCLSSSRQQSPLPCVSTNGGVIVLWEDNSAPWAARAQGVDEWGYLGAEPVMASVKDVPNDQGGRVKVSWDASPLDTDPLFRIITDYVVYRSAPAGISQQLARGAHESGEVTLDGRRYVRFPSMAQDYYWEELAHVTPRHLAHYSYLAATSGDSIARSNPLTAFMVLATATSGTRYWMTAADSGYSVDDLAPVAPAPLTGQYDASGTALHWNPNTEGDLAGYRLYRGSSVSFVPGPSSFVAELPDTGYTDAAPAPYFYKLTAVDIHGNESPVATLLPAGTLGVGDGASPRAEFAAPAPNPMRGGRGATLRFALAAGGHAKLAVYDAQGRLVRTLADGAREPGEHAIAFDGRDAAGRALAPGLYLARISAPGLSATRRIVIVE